MRRDDGPALNSDMASRRHSPKAAPTKSAPAASTRVARPAAPATPESPARKRRQRSDASRAEGARPEPARAESVRAEPARREAERAKAERRAPARPDPARPGPARPDSARAKTSRTAASRASTRTGEGGEHGAGQEARKYHHGDLRRALIDAALALIAEGELGTLSLREVARRAGVTPGAPYHHFKDKTSLLAAVAEEGFLALTTRMDAALAAVAASDARGRLAALARAYLTFARAHSSHYRVMFLPEVKHRDASASLHAAADGGFARLMEAIQAVRPRVDAATVQPRALITWAAAHGLVLLWNDGLLDKKLPVHAERAFLDTAVDQMVALAIARER